MSPDRDRKSETTTREKWPQKRLSASELSVAGFGRLGAETGLQAHFPGQRELFREEQGIRVRLQGFPSDLNTFRRGPRLPGITQRGWLACSDNAQNRLHVLARQNSSQ